MQLSFQFREKYMGNISNDISHRFIFCIFAENNPPMKTKPKDTSSKKTPPDFQEEYSQIMKNMSKLFFVERQWEKTGDNFVKFSLYENYTPVKTSGSTTLICDI